MFLADAIDGFIAGLGSGVFRPLWTMLALFLAFAVCVLPHWDDSLAAVMLVWLGCSVGGIAIWGSVAGAVGLLVGIAAVGVTIVSGMMYMLDQNARKAWFWTFAGAALYYAPLTLDGDALKHGLFSALAFLVFAAVYWLVPRLWMREG